MGVRNGSDGRRGLWRSRWAAIGAAVAVTFGGGGLVAVNAAGGVDSTTVLTDPVRVLDSRDPVNVGLAGPFASQAPQKLKITGSIPTTTGTKTVVPVGATGVLLNVTAVAPQAAGFISIRPGDATGLPSTSSLNFTAGQIVPNSVLVALPTGGANAGQIDITYDAFGASGPTTDILIDVVGYTNNSTLAALQAEIDAVEATNATQQTQINAKANSADVYSKAQADSTFLEQGQPIVLNESISAFHTATGLTAEPTTFVTAGALLEVSANGTIHMGLTAPPSVGGTSYRLTQVEYCIARVEAGAFVTEASLWSDVSLLAGLSTVAKDLTDRSTVGCFTLVPTDGGTARSYGMFLTLANTGVANDIDFTSVRSTWTPVGAAPTLSVQPELVPATDDILRGPFGSDG